MLPLETKIFVSLLVLPKDAQIKNGVEVAVGALSLFDERGNLRQGVQEVTVWPWKTADLRIAGCIGEYDERIQEGTYTKVFLKFPKYSSRVQWSLRSEDLTINLGYIFSERMGRNPLTEQVTDLARLEVLLKYDPLRMMDYTDKEKELLESCKSHYSKLPEKYINYLYSVNWLNP
jgi:hypothetical protein